MSQKANGIKALFYTLVVVCIACMTMCFCVLPATESTLIIPPSENESFLTLQQKYAQRLENTILKLLEPLVGRGHVQATVQVDLNLKNARHNISSYVPKTTQEIIKKQSFEKEIQNLIKRQNISVVIDGNIRKGDKGIYQPRTTQEMASYKRIIQSAVGYNPDRGDTLEVQNLPFIQKAKRPIHLHPLFFLATLLFVAGFVIIMTCLCCSHPNKTKQEIPPADFSPDVLDYIANNPTRAITVIKNWVYMPTKAKDSDWTPLQKIGIVLLALDEEIVRKILVALDDNEVRQVAKTMTSLGVIPPQESARILTELSHAMKNGSAVVGNPARVQQILAESPSEETLKFKETLQTPHSSLWQELASIDTQLLAHRLESLRPETTAYILYRLPPEKASELLQNFPENKTTQILIHLSHIGHIHATTNAKMEQEALTATRDILNTIHTPTGTEKTSEILSYLSQTQTGQTVLKDLNEKEPFLARTLASKLVHFEDIAHWPSHTIQTILRHTPKATAILALANASDSVKEAIRHNVPDTLWPQLKEDIFAQERRATTDQIGRARKEIVDNIKVLLNQGKIQL